MYTMRNDELIELLNNLSILEDKYNRETKDLISRLIVVEQNLIRLNHLLTQIRNMMADKHDKKS